MIADLLPLLAFTSLVVIARNLFEAYIVGHERRRMEAQERVRVRSSHHRPNGHRGHSPAH